jgi:aerobic C4-dicarboxylate transport protein
VLLLGVDRFMSQCRAATNFIANGVVTLAVARWEKELNLRMLTTAFSTHPEPEAVL